MKEALKAPCLHRQFMHIRRLSLLHAQWLRHASAWLLGAGTLVLLSLSCARDAAKPSVQSGPAAVLPVATPVVDVRDINRALTPEEAAAYAGDAACQPCHATICDQQNVTRHARTLRAVTVAEQGAMFRHSPVIADPQLGVHYFTAIQNEKCLLRATVDGQIKAVSADYVLGSGKNAYTYMSRITDEMWIDLRLSYYTKDRKWDYTPMQKPGDRAFEWKAGVEQSGERLIDCLHCHATVMRAAGTGIDAAHSDLGIHCERCHGPAMEHVKSFRLAANDPNRAHIVPIEKLGKVSRDRINDICGSCHRTPANMPPGTVKTESGLARFEGVALVRSACWLKSKSLSCVTCHDPHGDVDSSTARNDGNCLTCHGGSGTGVAHSEDRSGKICPVNKTSGCVKCHMPLQTIATIPHAAYHNHWIKVWKPQERSARR